MTKYYNFSSESPKGHGDRSGTWGGKIIFQCFSVHSQIFCYSPRNWVHLSILTLDSMQWLKDQVRKHQNLGHEVIGRMTANISITLSMRNLRFPSLNTEDGRVQAVAGQTERSNVIPPTTVNNKCKITAYVGLMKS